eukprot:311822-Chlamydomonas_euryale.AAC.6
MCPRTRTSAQQQRQQQPQSSQQYHHHHHNRHNHHQQQQQPQQQRARRRAVLVPFGVGAVDGMTGILSSALRRVWRSVDGFLTGRDRSGTWRVAMKPLKRRSLASPRW